MSTMVNYEDGLFELELSFRQLHSRLCKRTQAHQQKEMGSKLQQLQLKHEEDLRRLQQSQQAELQQLRVDLQQGHAVVLQQYREKHDAALGEIEEAHGCITVDDNEIEHASPEYSSIIASLARKYVWLVYELDRFITPKGLRKYVQNLVKENEYCATQNLRVSRTCHVCANKAPSQRVVYTNCGCVICRDCAEGFASENISTYGSTFCVMCMVDGGFVPLFEEKNEQCATPTSGFSRACTVCLSDSPRRRAVFSHCGHVLCLACATELKATAIEQKDTLTCPFCRCPGRYAELDGAMVETEQE